MAAETPHLSPLPLPKGRGEKGWRNFPNLLAVLSIPHGQAWSESKKRLVSGSALEKALLFAPHSYDCKSNENSQGHLRETVC